MISGSICPSLTLLSTDIKFKYQLEEKEIDVVEELELYCLMMSLIIEGGEGVKNAKILIT